MTAMPQHQHESSAPTHLLTIEEYAALGETESGYTELQEGRLLMSPSAGRPHMRASGKLFMHLENQLPEHLEVTQELDVDLAFTAPGEPGNSRRPDLVVYERATADRVEDEGRMFPAAEVLLVVEIVSPGSRRTDHKVKRAEYADAGIPHHWILDTTAPVSLLACRRTEEFGYVDDQEAAGVFRTDVPFPVTIDLNSLG